MQAPGEWSILLDLDRCPKLQTLCRGLRLLAGCVGAISARQDTPARQWMAADSAACATLAVDGHVKGYAGRERKLPKHLVARGQLCLPACVSYRINALGGSPLLCLHQELDPKIVQALEAEVVPHLEALGVLRRTRRISPRRVRASQP